MTQRLLERASGRDDYCALYACLVENCPGENLPVAFRTPCLSGKRIQKHHDLDLRLPISPRCKYVILFRKPFLSILSLYEWTFRNGETAAFSVNGERITVTDCEDVFNLFVAIQAGRWREFAKKWIIAARGPNIRKFDYMNLATRAEEQKQLVKFVFGEGQCDKDRLETITKRQEDRIKNDPNALRRPEDFRYSIDAAISATRAIIGEGLLQACGVGDVI